MNNQSRKVTCQLLDMMDQGAIDPKALVEMCLQYMSEADVADMAQSNDLLLDEEEEEDAA
ncbi:MAG: hypothetical protein EBT03_09405 [Betaproteobacteria bacterium]|nr:hypothetical protein [Betaproteobacteria bacterium]